MSGLVSGIGKIFQTVGSAATRVASSVLGVGAVTQTAGVAAGAGSMASGGLNGFLSKLTGGGVLGNIVSGAIKQAGYGAVLGGIAGMVTGQGFGKGALMGAAGGALTGGLMAGLTPQPTGSLSANTPTGLIPTGSTSGITATGSGSANLGPQMMTAPGQAAAAAAQGASATSTVQGGGLMSYFKNPETLGAALGGLGQGAGAYFSAKMTSDAQKELQKNELDYLRDKDQRIQDSYTVADSAFAAAPGKKMRYDYDPKQGKIVMVAT